MDNRPIAVQKLTNGCACVSKNLGLTELSGRDMANSAPPSVQVDGLGVGSLNCLCMLRDAPVINKAVLAHRKYDLVIFHIGSNTFHAMTLGACMKQVIARHREALPGVPLLIMTPPDMMHARVRWPSRSH